MSSDISNTAEWDELYLNGEWVPSESGETLEVEDPSTREVIAEVPAGVESDVDAAYEAAADAQTEWAEQPPAAREEIVQGVVQNLEEWEEEIAELLVQEAGGSRIMGGTSVHLATDQAAEAATLPRRMKGDTPTRTSRARRTSSSANRRASSRSSRRGTFR